MSQPLSNKKRNILQNLNDHLQVQAIKLSHIDRETKILPNSLVFKEDDKTLKSIKPHPIKQSVSKADKVSISNKTFTNTIVQKRQVRKLRPYDPLYTWNRGGRLKELRIRCQARKFLHIWIAKSLGRVTEMKATVFYRKQLLKRCWTIWYEQHWHLRIEPRLFGRAIIHRKTIVMRSVFLAWQWWTKLREFGRVKMNIAIKFHENQLKRTVIDEWSSWICVRKCKMKLLNVSDNWRKEKLLGHFLSVWKIQLIVQRETNEKMALAIHHRRTIVLRVVLHHWIEVGPDLKRERIGEQKAVLFYQSSLMKNYFDHWMQHHHRYRIKQKELEKWRDHYHWNLAQRFLKRWRDQYVRSLTVSVVDIRLSVVRRRFQLRRMFEEWRHFTDERRERKKTVSRAQDFYSLTVKKKILSVMKRFCVMAREKSDLRVRGREFNDKIILHRYLIKWTDMLEYKDDEARRVELGAARAHYRRATLIKCFRHFSQFVAQSNLVKERKQRADKFRQQKVLERSMCAWQQYIVIAKCKKSTLQIKSDYLKDKIVTFAWTLWRDKTRKRLVAKSNFNEFVAHKIDNDKLRVLRVWRHKAGEVMLDHNQMDMASMHYRGKLKLKCIDAMKRFVQQQQEYRCLEKMAQDHERQRVLGKILRCWYHHTRSKSVNTKAVTSHIAIKAYHLTRTTWDCWRTFLYERRLIYATVEDLYRQKMRENLKMRFSHWRRVSRVRESKRQKSLSLVQAAQKQLATSLLRRIFQVWKERALERNFLTCKSSVAGEYCRLRLLAKMFDCWRFYREQRRAHVTMREQAVWFWQKSQLTLCWVTWTQALGDRQREEYYTKYALSHWASKLQVRVLARWLKYKNERKKKREDETEAFELFQRRAKRLTIRQWLQAGDFLCQWRQSQNKLSNNESWTVWRAYEHWRLWTVTRISSRRAVTEIHCQPSREVVRPRLRVAEQATTNRKIRSRPAPKIPDFLLKPLERASCNVPLCDKQDRTVSFQEHSRPRVVDLESGDDELMPPTCFSTQKRERDDTSQSRQSCVEELNGIKERLLRFKETKENLRKLREEVLEYDRVLSKLTLDNDSSFCEEFDSFSYREELIKHVKQMEEVLRDELPVCNQLAQRAQALANMCKKH